MSRNRSTAIALILSLALAGCGGADGAAGASAASAGVTGDFSGTAKGFGGDVTVTLSLENNSLKRVSITGDSETPNVGGEAIKKLESEMNENQTVNVDAVSGATYTSTAVHEAVDSALKEAGLTAEDFPVIEKAAAQTFERSTDLLIIGGGGAGLTCGNSALEAGVKNVVILEKMPYTGGATSNAGGIDGGLSKLQTELGMTGDSAQLIHDDIMKSGEGHNEDLVWILAENQGKTLDWLTDSENVPFHDRYSGDFPEHTVQRFFVCDGGMSNAMSILTDHFKAQGGDLELETTAEEFITDQDGRVTGVVAADADGNTINYTADAVVVATGGYGANQEMISENEGDLQYAVFYGVKSSMGDGQRMGEAVDAKMTNMGYAKLYPNGIRKGADTIDGWATPMPSLQTVNGSGAIFVNKKGERFVNETSAFSSIKDATEQQPDEIMYLVMDQKGYDIWGAAADGNSSAAGRIPYDQQEEFFNSDSTDPTFARGSLEEAAAKAGIDADGLKKQIEKWNSEAEAGSDPEYGRTALDTIDTSGTIYIIEQRLRFATALGGYDITADFEAQNNHGDVIPGLYAIGEVVGGPNGTEAIPGSMAGWAVTSGYVCGQYLGSILAGNGNSASPAAN